MANSAGIQHLPQAPSPVVASKEVEFIPQPTQQSATAQNIVFKLVNSSRGDVYLPLFAQNVTNPKTKKPDTIRVLDGVYTIWESEQTELKLDPKTLSKKRRSVKFESNVARVVANDQFVLEALRLLPHNVEVPGHNKASRFAFYENNTQKQAEAEAVKRQLKRKAVRMAEEQPLDKLKKHATFLKVRVVDDYGNLKLEKSLRNDYEDFAELNPDKFLKSIGSPEVEIAYLISKGISEAKIDTSTNKGSAYWSTGGFICKIPSASKAFDYLIEYAMLPTEESKVFKEQLETMIT